MISHYGVSWDEQRGDWSISAASAHGVENTPAPPAEQEPESDHLETLSTAVEEIHGELYAVVKRLAELRDQIDDRL